MGGNSVETLDRGRFSDRKGPRNQYGIMGEDVEEQQRLNGKYGRLGRFCWLAGWLGQLIELNLAWSGGRTDRSTTIPAVVYGRQTRPFFIAHRESILYLLSSWRQCQGLLFCYFGRGEGKRRGRGVIAGPVCTLIEKQDVIRGIIRSLI